MVLTKVLCELHVNIFVKFMTLMTLSTVNMINNQHDSLPQNDWNLTHCGLVMLYGCI